MKKILFLIALVLYGAHSLPAQTNVFCSVNLPCTITAPWTFDNEVTLSNANLVQHAETFAGSTADVQINNCLAAIPSGGTCDTRGYGATTQMFASTVTVHANQTLVCDPATLFQASSTGLTMFAPKAGSQITGCSIDFGNQPTYSGSVFTYTDNYRDSTHTILDNIHLTGGGVTSGCGVSLTATSSSQSIYTLSITHVYGIGLANLICAKATGTGFINGIHVQDVHESYPGGAAYNFTATGGGLIQGNQFSNVDAQSNGRAGNGIEMTTSSGGGITSNTFSPLTLWDFATAININASTNIYWNIFQGLWNGGVTDSTNGNSYFSGSGLTAGGTQNLFSGTVKPGSGIIVSSLPSASANPGVIVYVTDSTAISAEGQTCVGGSTKKALAFSNGSVWKCF